MTLIQIINELEKIYDGGCECSDDETIDICKACKAGEILDEIKNDAEYELEMLRGEVMP